MGLGHAHEQRRRELLAAHRDGDPCPRCGEPTYSWQDLDADHVDTPRALGGGLPDALSHGTCNRRHGAQLQQALRGHEPRRPTAPRAEPIVTSRDW